MPPIPEPEPEWKRPEHWPECLVGVLCDVGQFYNDLVCGCFSDMRREEPPCRDGETLNPYDGETCMPDSRVRQIYPDWANEKDVQYSWLLAGYPISFKPFSRTYDF